MSSGLSGARGAHDVRWESGRAGADERQALLAYSSIAHAGYILVAFAAVTPWRGVDRRKQRRVCRGAFLSAQLRAVKLGRSRSCRSWRHRRKPSLALTTTRDSPTAAVRGSRAECLPAFAPWAAGYGGVFFGKFYIFKAAVNSHLMWLAVLMAINSVIGAYYYLRVIVVMYMRESSAEAKSAAPVGFPLTVNLFWPSRWQAHCTFGLFPNQVLTSSPTHASRH